MPHLMTWSNHPLSNVIWEAQDPLWEYFVKKNALLAELLTPHTFEKTLRFENCSANPSSPIAVCVPIGDRSDRRLYSGAVKLVRPVQFGLPFLHLSTCDFLITSFFSLTVKPKMIRAVLVLNTQGKPRLSKFYEYQVPLKPLAYGHFNFWLTWCNFHTVCFMLW